MRWLAQLPPDQKLACQKHRYLFFEPGGIFVSFGSFGGIFVSFGSFGIFVSFGGGIFVSFGSFGIFVSFGGGILVKSLGSFGSFFVTIE